MKIVIATNNQHKVEEYQKILKDFNIECYSLKDLNIECDVEETGKTFKENSLIKANAVALKTKFIVLADDSGLLIDALPNLLGVYSHRFLKDESYFVKSKEILKLLKDKPRNAHFECCITLLNFKDHPLFFEGTCDGKIANDYKGENGFGYDPIFIPNGYNLTMGEISEEEKNKISHRALACQKLIHYLNQEGSL